MFKTALDITDAGFSWIEQQAQFCAELDIEGVLLMQVGICRPPVPGNFPFGINNNR